MPLTKRSAPSPSPAEDQRDETVDHAAERERVVDDLAHLVVRQHRRRQTAASGDDAKGSEDDRQAK